MENSIADFKKIYALIPRSVYNELRDRELFRENFDRLVTNLLIEYLEKEEGSRDDRRRRLG